MDERGRSIDARLLTSKLKNAKNTDQLLLLVHEHGDAFNPIHCSAAWGCLGKQSNECRKKENERLIRKLLHQTVSQVAAAAARNLATIVHRDHDSRRISATLNYDGGHFS